jgi:ABC-2 type transport system ATP-binding protein
MVAVISASDLRKSFRSKGGPVEAVRGAGLEISQGEIFGFLAAAGAGPLAHRVREPARWRR